jgi:hypothetical protein
MAWAIYQCELKLVVWQMLQMRRQWDLQKEKSYMAPLQSTQDCTACSYGRASRTVKEEKPRSRVMPLSLLCGCLSRAAVDSVVDRAPTRLVLPLSTWPRTPTLMFRTRVEAEAILLVKKEVSDVQRAWSPAECLAMQRWCAVLALHQQQRDYSQQLQSSKQYLLQI